MKKITLLLILTLSFKVIAYSQEDSTKNELYGWTLLDGFLIEPYEFDTVIDYFQILNPIEHYSTSNSWLGNLGSAWKSNLFFSQFNEKRTDFIFDNNYRPYVFSKENQVFYHSKKPYFNIHWTASPKSRNENQLSVLYTQNINRKWNIGMRYKLISSAGEFPNSLVAEHSMNPFVSYSGDRYSMHAAFIRNRFKSQENGGVDTTNAPDPEFAQAFLQSASSVYYDRSFFFSQEYKFGFTKTIVINDSTTESTFKELGRINHVFSFDDNYRVYFEEKPLSVYYDSTYNYDDTQTRDSVRMAKFENSIYWTFKEIKKPNFSGRLTVGGTMENIKWINNGVWSTIDSINTETNDTVYMSSDTAFYNTNYNNIKLSGSLDARTKMFVFNVSAYYYLGDVIGKTNKADNFGGSLLISKGIMVGKRQSDFYFKLNISKHSPYLYQQRYESNHYSWDNSADFSNIDIQEIRAGLSIPSIRAKAEFAYNSTKNYIYFDSVAIPQQYKGEFVNVMSIRLDKDFLLGKNKKYGRFYIKNKIVYQIPPADLGNVIRLPQLAIYHSTYYNLDFFLGKYSIEAQAGYDLNFISGYDALGYNPAVGQFYQSNSGIPTGDYPVINAFLNMRIKDVLLFFRYENLFNQFSKNKYYFILDRYPMNTSAFRFGVSWRFKS